MDEDIEAFLSEGLENARWNTAVQAQRDLEKKFMRRFNYKTVWVWLKKSSECYEFLAPCMKNGTMKRRSALTRIMH